MTFTINFGGYISTSDFRKRLYLFKVETSDNSFLSFINLVVWQRVTCKQIHYVRGFLLAAMRSCRVLFVPVYQDQMAFL